MENKTKIKKILIVEDQKYTLDALEQAVQNVCPKYFGEFECDVAKWYTDAEKKIEQTSYDLILLDHRMPYDDPVFGEFDKDGGDAFFDTLQNIGYGLIDKIKQKNPETVIVGTSSLSNIYGFSLPEHKIEKCYGSADDGLEAIIAGTKINGVNN